MPRYRLGHKADPAQHEGFVGAHHLVGAAPPPLASHELMLPLVDTILDQPGQTCVGHGLAGCTYICQLAELMQHALAQGASNDDAVKYALSQSHLYPSPLFIFANACMRGGYSGSDGCRPIDAITALGDYGYCGIDAWPDDQAHMDNEVPEFPAAKVANDEAYRLAADQRTVKGFRVLVDGDEAVLQIKQGICALHPAAVAFQVDDAYMANNGQMWDAPGPAVGGHYTYAIAYTPDYLWTVGSYGKGFGDTGLVKASWRAVKSVLVCSDRYITTFAEAVEAAGS
jgi:hypothetical protein